MIAQKRRIRITLDLECYDDLDIETLDWKDLLALEGDENVYVSIKDLDDMYQCASFQIGTKLYKYNHLSLLYLITALEFSYGTKNQSVIRYKILK